MEKNQSGSSGKTRILGWLFISIKLVGWTFLVMHFFKQDEFLSFSFSYLLVYLLIEVVSLLITSVASAFIIRFRTAVIPGAKQEDTARDKKHSLLLSGRLRSIYRKPWEILLIPGEDGFFFLPLLYIGINPVTAFIASALFAIAHLNWKSLSGLLRTLVSRFLVTLIVLPHGILAVVIGHVSLNIFVLILGRSWLKKKDATRKNLAQ